MAFLAAAAAGGQLAVGVWSLVFSTLYATVLLLRGSKSDTVGILRGQPADERLARIIERATAHAGTAAIVAALVVYLWDLAHGARGWKSMVVLVPAGIAFYASIVWQQRRA